MVSNETFPIGFIMELAQHPDILNRFSFLTEPEQNAVIDGARQIKSHNEMRDYVESGFRQSLR